jgi:hypothetical protein
MDGHLLSQLKEQQNPIILKAAREEADDAMHQAPLSVTSKASTPPTGDKHDYISLAPYFWPNPATANHLPYVRRDGEHNPQANAIPDHANIFKMERAVHALAIGYQLTGKEEYAARATLLLRTWFLNGDTLMHPNLEFAQAVLGQNTGRGIGILEARELPDVTDAIGMLKGSKSWTEADQRGTENWFTAYFDWLTQSPHGHDEANSKNNHGSWYDVQTVGIALFLGKTNEAREILLAAKTKRIATQIEPDGQQPLEQARTKSFDYCIFNLEALMRLADLGERVGVDLWKYEAPNGASIRVALDYLLSFTTARRHGHIKISMGSNPIHCASPSFGAPSTTTIRSILLPAKKCTAGAISKP